MSDLRPIGTEFDVTYQPSLQETNPYVVTYRYRVIDYVQCEIHSKIITKERVELVCEVHRARVQFIYNAYGMILFQDDGITPQWVEIQEGEAE